MIYLDSGATSFPKPLPVRRAVARALAVCANPGRGGYAAAREADRTVYACREAAGKLFSCPPERVVLTNSCTQGLNIAIWSLISPGDRVVISGFEHNAVTRPLYGLGAEMVIGGRKLWDWDDTLEKFEDALRKRPKAAVFTHVSNVFGYILPVEAMAALCRERNIPFILDAAQSAGSLTVDLGKLGAHFIAMPGHKGLLGPQGTGLLLCGGEPKPLLFGGTGSASLLQEMPEELPDRLEPGTLNVPGFAGLAAGIRCVAERGPETIFRNEHRETLRCARGLETLGFEVFTGEHQAATLSFRGKGDCQELADWFAARGIALRAGLHCAPLAHESAGTVDTGTVRASFGWEASQAQSQNFLQIAGRFP